MMCDGGPKFLKIIFILPLPLIGSFSGYRIPGPRTSSSRTFYDLLGSLKPFSASILYMMPFFVFFLTPWKLVESSFALVVLKFHNTWPEWGVYFYPLYWALSTCKLVPFLPGSFLSCVFKTSHVLSYSLLLELLLSGHCTSWTGPQLSYIFSLSSLFVILLYFLIEFLNHDFQPFHWVIYACHHVVTFPKLLWVLLFSKCHFLNNNISFFFLPFCLF